MEITLIAIGLLFVAGLIYGGIKLNTYSEQKYQYMPINFLTILAMTIPFILLICGFFIFKENGNQILSVIFAIISAGLVFVNIQKKTDDEIALGATVILLFAGLALVLLAAGSSKRDDDYYR